MNPRNITSLLTAIVVVAQFQPGLAQEPTPLLTQPEEKLIAILKSDAPLHDRFEACRELSVIGSRNAVAPLVALLSDPQLSHAARYGLEPLPYPEVDQAFRESLRTLTGRQLVGVIGSLGVRRDPRAARLLADRLSDSDPDVAQAAARALGSIGTPAAAKVLEAALDTVSDSNRLAFAEGLFRCAERLPRGAARRVYDRLRQFDSPHQVRAGALRGAILIRGKSGLSLLRQSVLSGDLILVHAALSTAQGLSGSEVTTMLVEILRALPDDTRIIVLQTLSLRRDPAALEGVVSLANAGSPEVRLAAIRALGEMGLGGAVRPLVRLLHDNQSQIASAARESLAAMPGAEADSAVRTLLSSKDRAERLVGIELVVRRRMLSNLPDLFTAARDADAQIRTAAVRRLGELAGEDQLSQLLELLADAGTASEIDTVEQALTAVLSRIEEPEAQSAKLIARLPEAQPAQKAALVRSLGVAGGADALAAVCAALDDRGVRADALRTLVAWKTSEAAPELLALARNAEDATERTIALRGYLGWAANRDLPAAQRLAMCREVIAIVEQPDDKKLLLAALGRIPDPASLSMIVTDLDDAAVSEEASAATVAVAEELLKGATADEAASGLVQPLERAAGATTNDELARKAQSLLQQAKAKAGN